MMGTAKGSATETIETPDGSLSGSSEQVDSGIELTNVPQAEVVFAAGFTEPTKAYANVKVFVSLKLSVDVNEIDAGFDFCEEWVNERLSTKMKEVQEMIE
jgi:hypothetical protein